MAEQQISMFLVIFGAAVLPFVAKRIRVPSAALEIVYGRITSYNVCYTKLLRAIDAAASSSTSR